MAAQDAYKNELPAIFESVKLHQKSILEDINLTLRVITKDKTYITKLVDWPGEKFIFAAPLEKLDWVLFERDKLVKVAFVTKAAIFSANVQIINRYRKNEVLFYSAVLISPLIKQQQRQYFRLDVLLDVTYKVLPKDDKQKEEELTVYKGTSVNISIGGMCLVCSEKLHKDDQLIISFDFMNIPLEIAGEVLFEGDKTPTGSYSHRVRFLNQDNSVQNMLSRLIFEKQRLLINKPREMQ